MNDAPDQGTTIATYVFDVRLPPPVRFEHDPAGRVFRLMGADGSVEVCRDAPTRHLCVEPDAETGAIRPVIRRGQPVDLWLCGEEREAR